jgi:hypothetical protein
MIRIDNIYEYMAKEFVSFFEKWMRNYTGTVKEALMELSVFLISAIFSILKEYYGENDAEDICLHMYHDIMEKIFYHEYDEMVYIRN